MRLILLVMAVTVMSSGEARWLRRARSEQPKESSFVGEATNELSTAILQGYMDDSKNLAFSPLGYSALLAMLAEGARGGTKQELSTALHLPDDVAITRKTYNFIMERLKNTNKYTLNRPELKNWFYIYQNYTINNDYKKILEDCYLTEVRAVEKYTPYKPFNGDDDEKPAITEHKKPVPDYLPEKNKGDHETVDMLPPKATDEKLISFAIEDIPEKVDAPADFEYKPAKNIKEKIKLAKTYPKKSEYSSEEEETMVAVEARNHGRSLKLLNQKTDVTSSISVNSVGKKHYGDGGFLQDSSDFVEYFDSSLMIMFNGMYYRGAWKKPFDLEEQGAFYTSPSEKKQVPMLKTRGTFRTGSIPGFDSEAIELPYDGGRYSLIVVVPRARDGLARLIADLPSAPLSDLRSYLKEETLDVSLPSFYISSITKPITSLAKFGVSSIFKPDADLSGISPTEGLFVKEMAQMVAVRVDNTKVSASEMTVADGNVDDSAQESLKSVPVLETTAKKFSVEHPFVFFINDMLDNLVVVAGKVTDPQQEKPEDW